MSLTTDDDALEVGARLSRDVLDPMKRAFVGKDEVIDLLGVCLVGGENLFILGPPGTAKSALVHDLGRRLEGETFEYLLTRFTEPNEIFGPFDIRRLREGELITNTEGMLPEASMAFLDELLNANSAILNSLLSVLNERVFRRGRERRRLPLLMVVGASNHLPEDEALGALFDRFLMRVRCDNVPTDRLADVLESGWKLELRLGDGHARVHIDDVRELHRLLPTVDLTDVRSTYVDLVARLRATGISISDRRAVKLQRLTAASALLCGRRRVAVTDLWVLRHVWDREDQQEILAGLVNDVLAQAPEAADAHPRARASEQPDAEGLARDLDELCARLDEQRLSAVDAARLRDRLAVLSQRIGWIVGEEQRNFLQERAQSAWRRLEGQE